MVPSGRLVKPDTACAVVLRHYVIMLSERLREAERQLPDEACPEKEIVSGVKRRRCEALSRLWDLYNLMLEDWHILSAHEG